MTEAIIPTGIAFIGSLIRNFISYERLRLSECMHLHWERMSASAGSVICNSIDVRFERKADAGVLCKNPVCVGLH
ncbi:hypothetical protein EPG66_05875 [Pantoea pleuroti]|nr:hypothetical protein [Pantoea pleuroti]